MKQIIPFNKEIKFKTMIGEITSISLEHDLNYLTSHEVTGNLIVLGTYKLTEASQIEEDFLHKLPINILIDNKYETEGSNISITDFYYEIINEEILKVNTEITIDNLEEKEIEPLISVEEVEEDVVSDEDRCNEVLEELLVVEGNKESELRQEQAEKVEESSINEIIIPKADLEIPQNTLIEETTTNSLFTNLATTTDTYATYSVYIVKENDTLDSIIERYETTKEQLANYNNLEDIKIGSKIIIPYNFKYE